MKRSIKFTCVLFHRLWNGVFARSAFWGSLTDRKTSIFAVCITCMENRPFGYPNIKVFRYCIIYKWIY